MNFPEIDSDPYSFAIKKMKLGNNNHFVTKSEIVDNILGKKYIQNSNFHNDEKSVTSYAKKYNSSSKSGFVIKKGTLLFYDRSFVHYEKMKIFTVDEINQTFKKDYDKYNNKLAKFYAEKKIQYKVEETKILLHFNYLNKILDYDKKYNVIIKKGTLSKMKKNAPDDNHKNWLNIVEELPRELLTYLANFIPELCRKRWMKLGILSEYVYNEEETGIFFQNFKNNTGVFSFVCHGISNYRTDGILENRKKDENDLFYDKNYVKYVFEWNKEGVPVLKLEKTSKYQTCSDLKTKDLSGDIVLKSHYKTFGIIYDQKNKKIFIT